MLFSFAVQTLLLWIALELTLRTQTSYRPSPIVTLIVCLMIVSMLRMLLEPQLALDSRSEGFGVKLNEGNWETVKECSIPFDPYKQNPWTDPEEAVDMRIAKTLDDTAQLSESIEDFLRVNKPDSIATGS
jgi:hypothetical protein